MSERRPRILVTNDDGITSPGLHALHAAMGRIGEVMAVAPDAERSAVGHAITTLTPLRLKDYRRGGRLFGYACSGTPADCVKLAIGGILDTRPDLVVSGINLGPNAGTNVIYSGTVSAATEARMMGVPSIAVSLDTFVHPLWSFAAAVARQVATRVLERGLPDRVLLNVNVPNLPRARVKGIRVTRQGESAWKEDFHERSDPRRQPYYWLAGAYEMRDRDPQTDAWAIANGYVSITPITYDLTAAGSIDDLRGWGWRR